MQIQISDQGEALLEQYRTDIDTGKLLIHDGPGKGKSSVLRGLARRHNLTHARIASGPDRVPVALLDVARSLSSEVARESARLLRVSGPAAAIHYLDARLTAADVGLAIDDLDTLTAPAEGDLDFVFGTEREQLARVLARHARVATTSEDLASKDGFTATRPVEFRGPPLQLRNGRLISLNKQWQATDQDPRSLALLALESVLDDEPVERAAIRSLDQLKRRVWAKLPRPHREALGLLDRHERPLERALFADALARLPISVARDRAEALIETLEEWCLVLVEPDGRLSRAFDWSPAEDVADEEIDRLYHRALAESFSARVDLNRPPDDTDRLAHLLIEAQRHWLGAREPGRAAEWARYGAENLLSFARRRSIKAKRLADAERFGEAARLYDTVLALHGQADAAGTAGLDPKVVAYATHYKYYNRARAGLDPDLAETEDGYRRAVERWPGHAVFQSRLALVRFYQGHRQAALDTLQAADDAVAEHRDKQRKLFARTVERLLNRGRVLEALLVWDDRRADSLVDGLDVQRDLVRISRAGWPTDTLWVPGQPALHFHEPHEMRVVRARNAWKASILALARTAAGPTPVAALAALMKALRDETQSLLTSLTHTLAHEERLRKRVLLAAVDVVASRIARGPSGPAVMLGTIRWSPESNSYRFYSGEFDGLDFELSDEAAASAASLVDEHGWLVARVHRAHPGGPGTGPVLSVARMPAISDDEVEAALADIPRG